jgi:uncharacterized protein
MQNLRPNVHPCLTCGACCAFYRASFYWAETDDGEGGTVPAYLTEKVNDVFVAMKGMRGPHPRCVALHGTIGAQVYCAIYEQRASVCRDFPVSWEFGAPHDRCDKARAAWGLPPLQADGWPWPETLSPAA